ncbi:hypothetical protein [Amycolatopsis sp. PS_44_ISF1]|uniref:hypothetical protein n=1 Tax=Amycolatopsis sp. PS_44_ISF1 TaxID=2974917 RepID=UPI0028DF42F5|nr:hypothetical protein [Amycolatopsis sp. PS_44_ISF1]MDT8914153.1 hypothetical protein [Amycolatopsis sp. PS_44_ISF1]
MAKVLGTSVLLLSVAACGGQPGPGAPAPSTPAAPAPGSSSPLPAPPPSPSGPAQGRPTQGVPPGDTAPAPGQVDASALPAGYPHDLTLAEGGKVVVIQAEEGGCDKISARAGEQTAEQAVVLVTVTKAPRGQMCPMHIKEASLPVPLEQPLGGRKLVLRPGS